MFDSEQQMIKECIDDPSLIFTLIKRGEFEVVYQLVHQNKISVNLCDSIGNSVVTRLLKAKQYDLVISLMKKRNWDVNHQNVEGDTFGHILALDDSIGALKIIEQLTKKKNYIPNIKNNKGETVLDRAINSNYIYTAFKILEDKRFNNIDIVSFKKLWNVCIKNAYYGKYAKLNNLDIIVGQLEKKELIPSVKTVVDHIQDNLDVIKEEIMKNNYKAVEHIIDLSLDKVIV